MNQWITNLIPTLAEGGGNFIVLLFIIGAAVISTLAKAGKEKKEQQNRQHRPQMRPGEQQTGSAADRLAELAERRRRQLQELAQRRTGGAGQSTRPAPPRQRPTPTRQHEMDPEGYGESVEQHIEEAEHRRKARELAERQRQQAAADARSRAIADRERQAEIERQRKIAERMKVFEGTHDDQVEQVHRHVRDARIPASVHAHAASPLLAQLKTNRVQALRQAIIMKEILDKPIALRPNGWEPVSML